ncbi:PREDICTED: F-box/LRR-repeat protein At2g42730-like [Camelina sativa]|uniref:F-box/LRR-repeat protein At2g42730-like n=1 Tax=Camelina sativa TaxID=90675 RepID=A0ABM0WBK3_CAMSA|nr:PREDICTED: F-box/LRR-repeat protein At2g42730-like [Camelina sativa]
MELELSHSDKKGENESMKTLVATRLVCRSLEKRFTRRNRVGDGLDPACVQSWICNVLNRGVVDLDLFITFLGKFPPVLTLNLMNKTLVKLSIGSLFIVKLSHDVFLPLLKKLCLYSIDFDGDRNVVETLLSRCPVLQEFEFSEMKSEKHLPVQIQWSSPSLKRLRIRFQYVRDISFDFPNLAFFEISYEDGSKFLKVKLDSLIEARLNHLSDGGEIWGPVYGNAHVNMIHLINAISNVRVLHLSSVFHEGLKHHISKSTCGDVCVCYGSKENRSSCLSTSRVKVLEISGYGGDRKDLNQVKHFLAKLPCLELVRISAANDFTAPIDICDLLTLDTLPRASPKCKIEHKRIVFV